MTTGIRSYPNRPWKSTRTVTDEHGETRTGVLYRVLGSTATIRAGRQIVVERADVVNLERVPPFKGQYNYVITFANGDQWTIDEKPGCGCGGSR